MKRRAMLALTGWSLVDPAGASEALAAGPSRHVALGAVTFAWHHDNQRLYGTLTAPTSGWIAVGFNTARSLAGTRFVIAVTGRAPRVEMHVAGDMGHPTIESLGGQSGLADISGESAAGSSILRFSLPHHSAAPHPLELAPGTPIHLMLAWSHEADFAHHSAWRRHLDVVL